MGIHKKFSESLKNKIKKQFSKRAEEVHLCYIGDITV
ncbi:Uncharacterised protein [Enterococcus malodoratus]|uniref:Uncharacterized protein n=1 Tax=Enterococcus malodoratus ATCC 43197 TaxID=1158601 RepID=R2NKM8_9ENTE|nr:hypothetical protein UAI_04492 [Enterococcus malodoratus ATCC 43197]EOT69772.1 hypothetical protein I585_01241 [Enterococcus malodoratus ATCC 43197]SPX01411.1 Uncharacterised protein [Enterococcus malodoratus]STC70875.1 Uncharacterised protein [Enterococcus malodoratus]